jgi:hypothetical protein
MRSLSDRRQEPGSKPQKPLSKPLFYGGIGVTLVCAITLVVIALRGVPADSFGYGPHLLILLAVAIFVVASLAITEIIPWRSRSLRDWQRPKVMGSFVGLVMGAVGLAAGLTPLFNPPAATEKTVEDVRQRLEDAGITRGEASLIERNIVGMWGEPGCKVTYEMALDIGLLTIVSRKSVPGQSPLRLELQAEPGTGGRMVASVLMPLSERGDLHEFRYQQTGTREFLTWVIKKREISLQLDRCREG